MKMTMKKNKQTTMESMDEFVCFRYFCFSRTIFIFILAFSSIKKKKFIFQNPDENDDDV